METKPIKLLIIGDIAVGKTCLLLRYIENVFMVSTMPGLGIDFKLKTIEIGSLKYQLQIYDSPGADAWRSIARSYYKRADGIILAFDITDRKSYRNIRNISQELSNQSIDKSVIILVGTKSDLGPPCFTQEEFKELLDEIGLVYFETSAKLGLHIESTFFFLAEKIARSRPETDILPAKSKSFTLNQNKPTTSKKCCGA